MSIVSCHCCKIKSAGDWQQQTKRWTYWLGAAVAPLSSFGERGGSRPWHWHRDQPCSGLACSWQLRGRQTWHRAYHQAWWRHRLACPSWQSGPCAGRQDLRHRGSSAWAEPCAGQGLGACPDGHGACLAAFHRGAGETCRPASSWGGGWVTARRGAKGWWVRFDAP